MSYSIDEKNAYVICKRLYDLVKGEEEEGESAEIIVSPTGNSILTNLSSTIGLLINNWGGADAAVHINNLINLQTWLELIVNATLELTADSANLAVDVQQTVSDNGAKNYTVEGILSKEPITSTKHDKLPENVERKVDVNLDEMNTAASKLNNIHSNFDTFKNSFNKDVNTLMSEVWISGLGKERAETAYSNFSTVADNHLSNLSDALSKLKIAIANHSNLPN